MQRIFLFLSFLLVSTAASAQKPFVFTRGLVAQLPYRYGREAIYTDELAARLYGGTVKTPAANDTIGQLPDGQAIIWRELTASPDGYLRGMQRMGGAPAGPGVQAGALRGGLAPGGGYIYLVYEATKAGTAILNIRGNSGVFVNGVQHAGDPYNMGFMHLPVALRKGKNEFYVRGLSIQARLDFTDHLLTIKTDDSTMPYVVPGLQDGILQGAVLVVNQQPRAVRGLRIKSVVAGRETTTSIPDLPAMSSRKVPFSFDAGGITSEGKTTCRLQLLSGNKSVDTASLQLTAVPKGKPYNSSFVSSIDGSLQYFAVNPSSGNDDPQALFFSVHGAGVEGINQARAYQSKNWGNLVAPTNRRPRGFNWEDWGRLDALEVLAIAKNRFNPDPSRVYLTGHSMGGHGTWFLGATYPDKWAAIAPCAGYPTLKGYGSADGLVPDSSSNPLEQRLLRAGNQSDVIRLANNYKAHGVYIHHGDADRTVSVNYARQMRSVLAGFHADFAYYEYPGGSHWFSDESVDWKPLFEFFRSHRRLPDSSIYDIDFTTANPGISDRYRWAAILQQQQPLNYSRLQLQRVKDTIKGNTSNVATLQLDLPAGQWFIALDGQPAFPVTSPAVLRKTGNWSVAAAPSPAEKNPARYGTFKDAFRNRMVFVYGTKGNVAENAWAFEKARFDAESWYYRGNGAIDVIRDVDYDSSLYRDRGVVLYGNAETNTAYAQLLAGCPVQISRGKVSVGNDILQGDDLGAYFVWPLANSHTASVAVIGGTGIRGMQAAMANQYFAGASGFPDYMVFRFALLQQGVKGVEAAGFFDNNWRLPVSENADL